MTGKSAIPRVSVVAEGPTDWIVIQAVLDSLDVDYEFAPIQPEVTAIGGNYGELGGGWRGVLGWCQRVGAKGGLEGEPAHQNAELLVIHVDADVSQSDPFNCHAAGKPGPRPFADTIGGIEAKLLTALGGTSVKLLLCIPHIETEAWLLPIFRPLVANPEAELSPADHFVGGEPKLCRYEGGRLRKTRTRYEEARRDITAGWHLACAACDEARHFTEALVNHIAVP